jgi:hypothetical protein
MLLAFTAGGTKIEPTGTSIAGLEATWIKVSFS